MLKILQAVRPYYHQIFLSQELRCLQAYSRSLSTSNAPVNEKLILEKLRDRFPSASAINVEDTSGGCGAMFNVSIETAEFKGLTIPKQHRLVYDTLKDEISKIHGLHLQTKAVG